MQELLEQIKTLLPTIQGWCSFEKAKALVEHIIEMKANLVVELGVFGGSSCIPAAMALKHTGRGIIYGVDPWSKDAALEDMISDANKEWWSKVDLEDILSSCQAKITEAGVEDHCYLIRAKAEDAVTEFNDNYIDLLHIDGNHAEALALRDARLYLPKVRAGGVIFFDDIYWTEDDSSVPTTRKAVMYLLEHCEQIGLVGDCMILRKN